MFKTLRFVFHSTHMVSILKAALRLKKKGDNQQALVFLRKALEAGHSALNIQSPKISEQERSHVASGFSSIQKLYQKELIAQMPEDDRNLFMSFLKSWKDMGIATINAHLIDQMIDMFDTAKSRLASDKETLGIIYKGDHVPAPLRNIMQLFLLEGGATREETERRLGECMAKLGKWRRELFLPGKPLHTR